MEEFNLFWNNHSIARIIREPNGNLIVVIEKSRFNIACNEPMLNERFLSVLNVVTYYRSPGGFDLHLPNGEVLYGINVVDIIHVVTTYVPQCPEMAAEFRNRLKSQNL